MTDYNKERKRLSVQMNPKIKPIPLKQKATWSSKEEQKFLRKKGYKIKTLYVPDVHMFIRRSLFEAHFITPKTSFLKSQKILSRLITCRNWLVITLVFFPLKNILRQLRVLRLGVNNTAATDLHKTPHHRKRLKKFFEKLKRLEDFHDIDPFLKRQPLKICPLYEVRKYRLSPSIKVSTFPRLQHLSIEKVMIYRGIIDFPPMLKEISLIEQEPGFQSKYAIEFFEGLIHKINLLDKLERLNLVFPYQEYYVKIFEILSNNKLTVKLSADIETIVKSEAIQETFKSFIQRTGSNIGIIPRNCKTETLIEFLSFLGKQSDEYKQSFFLETISFNLHSKKEIHESMIEYFTLPYTKINEIVFSFSTNSFDCFTQWRRENWERMLSLAYSKANETGSLKIKFDIEYCDVIQIVTLEKIIHVLASLINQESVERDIVNKKELHITISIGAEVAKDKEVLVNSISTLLSVCKKVDLLVCQTKFGSENDSNTIAKKLREFKEKGVLKKYIYSDP